MENIQLKFSGKKHKGWLDKIALPASLMVKIDYNIYRILNT